MSSVSILNHVLGPIMRGPSSSHSAAALRIGRMALDLMGGRIKRVEVDYDPTGSLVTTHDCQGSDLGLFGGLMGWEPDDARLPDYAEQIVTHGIDVNINYVEYGATHPNTYRLRLENENESEIESHSLVTHTLVAVSLGGGMIEVQGIDEAKVSLTGGSYVLLVFLKTRSAIPRLLVDTLGVENCVLHDGKRSLVEVQSRRPFEKSFLGQVAALPEVATVRVLNPVIPVLDSETSDAALPFTNCDEMLRFNESRELSLPQLALEYEMARSGMSAAEIIAQVRRVLSVMKAGVEDGLQGTEFADRILPSQIGGFRKARAAGKLVGGSVLHDVIQSVTAVLEIKSSMGAIVAAPTAGSCGVVPGALLGVAQTMNPSEKQLIDALLACGVIGMFIARGATFAAEEGGCMAECGSAAGMVAAGIVTLNGGSVAQSIAAASMSLQNSFGMTCDTVANRVEAPCLGKNTMSAANAVASADMAVAGYEHLIPLDEVIAAMAKVGEALPRELCCTGLGGLAITPTSKQIESQLVQIGAAGKSE
jgi:L-serine dehydratase